MNPMDQLRAARPAHLDTPVSESTRAAELSHAMAQARPVRRRKIAKPVWGLGLAGAAAAVTAVAVAVTTTGGTTPSPTAVAVPSTTKSTQSTQPVLRLSAKQVLLVAAESSLKAREESGAYWYVEGVSGSADQVGTSVRYTVHRTSRNQLWVARSPKSESWFVDQNLGTKPAPGAEDAWKKDGSPTKWTVDLLKPGAKGPTKVGLTIEAKAGKPFGNSINVGDKVFDLAGRNVSVAELQSLPTTAAALKRRLLKGYAGHGTESNDPQDADSWLYQVASGLLRDMPVKPAVRAAAYQVLAGLDGVRSLGEVTDPLGRKGQGVARTEKWITGTFEHQLLVDPETGVLLTDQIVAVHGIETYAWAKPGTAISWSSTTEASWTDKKPVKPE
ncbi:CU044_5270 family protein [Streptosporangium sp. 'caverna']|uniref:CU044_5270 family protein n=1 Tax=Streptosporangium sp. 'caverna' TaxID=2202249 RepID=UPI000D7EA3D4|nr:CU044_5270 family protein [Streptosporangium sp. 'caverna']AWS47526.1 hypothetical protein DKM19_45810 [Streptosporangium sp. 'caverna']